MKQIEKLPLFGFRGKTYFFNVYPVHHEYPEGAGVYIFANRVPGPNAKYTVISIGETSSFNNVAFSLQHNSAQNNGANTICFMPVEKEADRLAIALELEERYKPESTSYINR